MGCYSKSFKSRLNIAYDVSNDIPKEFGFCKSSMGTPLD